MSGPVTEKMAKQWILIGHLLLLAAIILGAFGVWHWSLFVLIVWLGYSTQAAISVQTAVLYNKR